MKVVKAIWLAVKVLVGVLVVLIVGAIIIDYSRNPGTYECINAKAQSDAIERKIHAGEASSGEIDRLAW